MASLFKKKAKQASTNQIPPELFLELCRDGERADLMVGRGQAAEANEIYQSLLKRQIAAGVVDEFLMAKLCLSSMVGALAMNNLELAHGIWTGNLPGGSGPYFQVGIQAMETGVCEVRDTLIYQAIGCFLHACNPDLRAATQAVNATMAPVIEKSQSVMKDSVDGLLGHWKYCLTRIYDDDPAPADLMSKLEKCAQRLGLKIPERGTLALIKPSPWRTRTVVL